MSRITDNTVRRRVIRTPITSAWNGLAALSMSIPNNVGMAQHQLWYDCDTVPTAGTLAVNVRPAKANFFVPLTSINLASTPASQVITGGIIDAVELSVGGLTGTLSMDAGLNSVGTSYTPSPNRSDVDRPRFASKSLAAGWNGSSPISTVCPEHDGYGQHQIAIAGGTGNVSLYGRPSGSGKFVLVSQFGNAALPASGVFGFFPGLYDAFMLKANGTLTGSINAQIVSFGHEMMLKSTAWQAAGVAP